MKVWISKYALTKGIYEEIGEPDGDYFYTGPYRQQFGRGEWHATVAEAARQAETLRQKKIASLRKQIVRLEKLTFEDHP